MLSQQSLAHAFPLHAGADAIGVTVRVAQMGFAGERVLEDIEVRLESGTITCLLGPSGAGKSTLLRLLAGQHAGEAQAELCCDDGRPLVGRVAWMDQRDLLLPWLDVLGNVTFGARLRGQQPDETGARELLRQVGLQGSERALVHTLSGGMRQRVALARTLMERSPLVLMDEPFSALDALTRHRLQALAVSVLAGRTVLMVTHDPMEALRVGHRLQVLSGKPATLSQVLIPPGAPARDVTGEACLPVLRQLQADLGLLEPQPLQSARIDPPS